jgi:hypothetical protein
MLLGIAFLRRDPAAVWPLRATSVELLAIAATALLIYGSPLFPLSLRFSAAFMPACGLLISLFAWRRGAISRLLEHPVLVRSGGLEARDAPDERPLQQWQADSVGKNNRDSI